MNNKYKNILTEPFLIEEYTNNQKTMKQIGKTLNIPDQTIWKYLKKYKISMHRISWKLKINKYLLKKYYIIKKYSLRKTAKLFGSSVQTISRYLIKYNLTVRTCKEGCCLLNRNGINNPMSGKFGKNHPAFKHGGVFYCRCGELISDYRRKRCSKCYGEWRSKHITGKRCGSWQGGLSFEPYSSEWTNSLREQIRKQNHYKCVICSISNKKHIKEYKDSLCIHHVDYNKKNCKKSNLITLCYKCHSKTNSARDYWYAYFKYIKGN